LDTESLVDRQRETAEVAETITEGGKLFLIGPPRYGKTSGFIAKNDLDSKPVDVILH
jgi:hypothetical protein